MSAIADVSKEYQVKAVFLFRFTGFVEWPPEAFATPASPIIVEVLGSNPFENALQEAVQGETIRGHKLIVKQVQDIKEIGTCHVIFICRSEAAREADILAALKGRSVLTVSDDENFTANGGMIQFITKENRICFKINRRAAEESHLKLSSKLLRLAQ